MTTWLRQNKGSLRKASVGNPAYPVEARAATRIYPSRQGRSDQSWDGGAVTQEEGSLRKASLVNPVEARAMTRAYPSLHARSDQSWDGGAVEEL